ncbi:hypothetical protein SAMN05216525_15310 [Bradyrhizobium sp. Gha]|nr:hypothetical protein SAMN05216525_15310 [Bradyrhizobium sp. Gha]
MFATDEIVRMVKEFGGERRMPPSSVASLWCRQPQIRAPGFDVQRRLGAEASVAVRRSARTDYS